MSEKTAEKDYNKRGTCGDCSHWIQSIRAPNVLGQCNMEMETKMAHQSCSLFEERKKK